MNAMASFCGAPGGFDDDSGPEPRPGDTGGPVLAGGPVVFLCCDPCASNLCVRPDCDHGELDEKTFANAADALDLLHEGCLCFVMPKGEHDKKTD